MKPAVGLQRARGTKNCLPLCGIDGPAHVGDAGEENVVLDVEDAGGLVRSFEEFSEIDELVSLVPREGRAGEALEEVGVLLDLLKELVRPGLPDYAGVFRLQEVVSLVQRLEHLEGDLVAHLAGVFPSGEKTGDD